MKLTLDQVREHPLWRGLTDKERTFFELLEENDLDDVAAAQEAFDLQPQSIRPRLNQICAAIDTGFLYRGMMGFAVPSRDELIAALWHLHSKTKDQERKYRCLAKIADLQQQSKTKPPKGDEPQPDAAPSPSSPSPSPSIPIPDLSDFKE